MIVEFIGSTGAGKTTLISAVQRKLAETLDVTTSVEMITGLIGLEGVTNITVQNLVRELVGFPRFIGSLGRYRPFLRFTWRMIGRQNSPFFIKLNYLRSIERKIGVEEIIRRHNHGRIILVDEGMVLSAYLTFVYTDVVYTAEEVTQFTELIPLPDLIVYIRAPFETLLERTRQRPDPPREIRMNPGLLEKYIQRAVDLFEQLVEMEKIRDRVLIVEDQGTGDGDRIADQIAKFISNYEQAIHYV